MCNTIRQSQVSREEGRASLFQGAILGRIPDGKAECDLVHKVGKVVHQIQSGILDTAQEISERVDRPIHCDDETHGAERSSHVLVRARCCVPSFTCEDLEQDENPSAHATTESNPWVHKLSLTSVAKGQHCNSTQQQTPEHHATDTGVHGREDQVELNHLQRNCDRPIDVTIKDGGCTNDDPELTHVEIMHSCNYGNQGTNIQRRLPMFVHCSRFHQKEH